MEVSKREIDILIHTLGYNKVPRDNRNMFITDSNDQVMLGLVDKGLMKGPFKKSFLPESSAYFLASDLGLEITQEKLKQRNISL